MNNKYIHGKAKYHSLLEKTMKEDRNLKKQIIVAVSVAAGILTALVLTAVLAFETLSRAQKNEAERYLDEVTEQYRNTMIKQIEGNLQTLEALATIIGNNIMDMDKVMDILETEIIRMISSVWDLSNPTEEEILLICRGSGWKMSILEKKPLSGRPWQVAALYLIPFRIISERVMLTAMRSLSIKMGS